MTYHLRSRSGHMTYYMFKKKCMPHIKLECWLGLWSAEFVSDYAGREVTGFKAQAHISKSRALRHLYRKLIINNKFAH